MIEKTLARRYAAALLAIAAREKAVDEINEQIRSLSEIYRETEDLRLYLRHPRVSKKEKQDFLKRMFGGQAHGTLMKFLNLLVDKGRIECISTIAEVFDKLAIDHKGIARVRVDSFLPLAEEHRSTLHGKLAKMLGKEVVLDVREDRSLKGGMRVRIDDMVIDGSVANRFKELREELLGVHQ